MRKFKAAAVTVALVAPLWLPVIAEARSSWGK